MPMMRGLWYVVMTGLILLMGVSASGQEIDVSSDGVSIECGDRTPTRVDGTDFGSVGVASGAETIEYLIRNTGNADLSLPSGVIVSGAHAGDFAVTQPAATVLGHGTSSSGRQPQTPFSITFDPSASGIRTATVSIDNNDPDENPFTFDIQGYGDTGAVGDIHVSAGGEDIFHGDDAPSTSDGTDFGDVAIAGAGKTEVFTLTNQGSSTLILSAASVVGASGFSVTAQPGSNILASTSTTLEITFSPATQGLQSATVSIPSDDPDENPYEFAIQGIGTTPEIDLQGQGLSIRSGDDSPSEADDTDFGAISVDGDSMTHTFTILNTGNSDLALTGTPLIALSGDVSDFTATPPTASSLRAGQSITFTISFDATAAGLRSAVVSIESSDEDEPTYTFHIRGTAGPDIRVRGNGVVIDHESTATSSLDHTDFGGTPVGGDALTRTFDLENLGPEELLLEGDRVTLSGSHAADFTVTRQPESPVAAESGATTFEIAFEASAAGDRTATVHIDSNDPDEDPYEFAIQATGLVPGIDVLGDGHVIPFENNTPSLDDKTDFGEVDVRDGEAEHTFEIRNTGQAPLDLTGATRVEVSGPHATEFQVTLQPSSPVTASGGTASFRVTFNPADLGARSASIRIESNDADKNPYVFDLVGTGSAVPDIEVLGNGHAIPDGDLTPASEDGTDFGSIGASSGQLLHTFDISNTGSGSMTLGNGVAGVTVDNPVFVVTRQPDASIPSGSASSFEMAFDPVTAGAAEAMVTVHSDDPDQADYTFKVCGLGTSNAIVSGGSGGNLAPIPDAGPDQMVHVGQTVLIDGSRSQDPDAAPHDAVPSGASSGGLRFEWSFTVRYLAYGQPVYWVPAGSRVLGTASGFDTSLGAFVPDLPGEYRLTLKVTDAHGDSLTDQVVVHADPGPDDSGRSTEAFRFDRPSAFPNPFRNSVVFSFEGTGHPETISVCVYDLAGGLVWQGEVENADRLLWDGRDSEGQRLPKGAYVYVCLVAQNGQAAGGRSILFAD